MFTGDYMCAEGVAVLSLLGYSKVVCCRSCSSKLQVAKLLNIQSNLREMKA